MRFSRVFSVRFSRGVSVRFSRLFSVRFSRGVSVRLSRLFSVRFSRVFSVRFSRAFSVRFSRGDADLGDFSSTRSSRMVSAFDSRRSSLSRLRSERCLETGCLSLKPRRSLLLSREIAAALSCSPLICLTKSFSPGVRNGLFTTLFSKGISGSGSFAVVTISLITRRRLRLLASSSDSSSDS